MTTHASIGVNDDLASSETRIRMWAAKNKLAGWIHKNRIVVVAELFWHGRANHMLNQVRTNCCVSIRTFTMLCRDEHGTQPNRFAVFVIEGDLSFAVGTKIWNQSRFADLGESLCESMCKPDWQWH